MVVIGTGDHARVVMDLLATLGRDLIGLVEPGERPWRDQRVGRAEVIGNLDEEVAWSVSGPEFVVAVGDNRRRASAFQRCLGLSCQPVAIVHPSAILLGGASIEPGAQVCAGAIVGVSARVGRNAIINTAASLDHDDTIGAHAFIGPGARLGGRVRVGEGAHVGIGSTVRQATNIGSWAFIAAGSVVVADVEPSSRVAGVPARPMVSREHEV